jgi:hypothetical protein
VCIIISDVMLMLLSDFGPYGIIFMAMCVFTTLDFPVILDGQFSSDYIICLD